MHLRASQHDFDHQVGGFGIPQNYNNQQNNGYTQQASGYGYGNPNGYSSTLHHGALANNQASQSVEIFSPKSFLSQNASPKSPFLQSQQLTNGGKMQQATGQVQQQGQTSQNQQQQIQQQINYSNSTSNLSTKRDYLSSTNRFQQGSSGMIQQQQQQQQQYIGQQQLQQQQNHLQQQQQQSQPQPLKNNFFQQNSQAPNQKDSQSDTNANVFQGGYSILNQQTYQNQLMNQGNGLGKKASTPSQQQQQQQQIFSQNQSSSLQQQQQHYHHHHHHQQQQLGMNGKVSPSANNNTFNNNNQNPSQPSALGVAVTSEMRHTSADAMRNKENLQNTLQKIYYNQPQANKGQLPSTQQQQQQIAQQQASIIPFSSNSTSNLHAFQKSNSLANQAMRPSSREGYTTSTQSSTLNSNRQQIRASTSTNQLDNRLQRNSYSQQHLKNSNVSNSLLGQNVNSSQMKENMILNGNNTFSMNQAQQQQQQQQLQSDPNSYTFQKQFQQQKQSGVYEQQNQMGFQQGKNHHMYQSGIVQTNSQISNHNMKRSEIIEMKHSNYLNSPKYQPSNTGSQYNTQVENKEAYDKKENYTLFPSNQNDKNKPSPVDSRASRQKSQYKEGSSGNNNSHLQIESATPTTINAQKKEMQRVQSATTTSATQAAKRSQNFEYKTSKNSKVSLAVDSQTPKSGEDRKINFLSDTKQVSDINSKELQYGMNGSSSSTTLRNNLVGTSQSQYIQSRQSTIIEKKNGNDKSAALFNETKGKQTQSTIFPSQEQSITAKSKSPAPVDNKKAGSESRVYSDEYQEYKKLQEKLNYLESKIMSIKTNIDSTYQKEKEEQRKETTTTTGQLSKITNAANTTRPMSSTISSSKIATVNQQLQPSSQINPSGYTSSTAQSKLNQDTYQKTNISSPQGGITISERQSSINSTANKYSRDEDQLYPSKNASNQKASGNSFSIEQSSAKASAVKTGVSSSTSNLFMKNSTTNIGSQVQSSAFSSQIGNSSTNQISSSTQSTINNTQGELTTSPSSKTAAINNPLSSFVTQVSKGSGIPLSPKTATNITKRNKIEEKISSTIQYDPNTINNGLQPNIPKSYLNKTQLQQQQQQSSQSKSQEGSIIVTSSVTNSSSKSNNASYNKRRDDNDSIDGSIQPATSYYPSSTKNQTSQGKNSLILTKNNTNTQSAQSLKNSNILASPTSTAYKKNISGPPYIYYISPIIKAYLEPQNSSVFAGLAREHLIQTMQAISFSRMLKPASQKVIDEKKVYLPSRRDNKKTLVFDLDETLIHCNENASIPSDVILPIKFPTGEIIEAGINVRPYCMEILQELSKYYELIVFTASHSCYANVVLDYLDPKQQYITGRLFRENCVTTDEGVYIKDLRVIANRNLSDMVLVDNAAYSFGFQIDNGIPIIPFYDNKSDAELKHLIHFMKSIHNVRDLRDIMRKFLKVGSFSEFSDPHSLISTLFEELI